MRSTGLLILVFLLFGFRSPRHAIYISTVEINYNSATTSLGIILKVFTDDLQDALRNYSSDFLPSAASEVAVMNKALITSYFNDHLNITVNSEKMELKFVEGSEENDTHILIFSSVSSDSEKWKNMKISGAYFSEVFPDQSNVFTIHRQGKRYFARLTKSQPEYIFTFD